MEQQRLLIDTNVILDFLLARKPFDVSAEKILMFASKDYIEMQPKV